MTPKNKRLKIYTDDNNMICIETKNRIDHYTIHSAEKLIKKGIEDLDDYIKNTTGENQT